MRRARNTKIGKRKRERKERKLDQRKDKNDRLIVFSGIIEGRLLYPRF